MKGYLLVDLCNKLSGLLRKLWILPIDKEVSLLQLKFRHVNLWLNIKAIVFLNSCQKIMKLPFLATHKTPFYIFHLFATKERKNEQNTFPHWTYMSLSRNLTFDTNFHFCDSYIWGAVFCFKTKNVKKARCLFVNVADANLQEHIF